MKSGGAEMGQIPAEYQGTISPLTIGGGKRKKACCGGHTSLPFLSTPYQRPLLALAVYDVISPESNPFLKNIWGKASFPARLKKAEFYAPDLLCLRFLSANPDLSIGTPVNPQELLEQAKKMSRLPFIVTGCGDSAVDEEFIPVLSQTMKGENALMGVATEENYRMLTAGCLANGHSLIVETPDDLNIAKQLNILITELGLPVERIAMHHVTAALGYGLEYTYSIMEKCRLAGLEGDRLLSPVMLNFIGQETWKTKEAQEAEELGINWEVTTAVAYLEAGAEILVLDHPESVLRLHKVLDDVR
jgi:acetyl-CoA decarbonylase/synthase complex subunit delta